MQQRSTPLQNPPHSEYHDPRFLNKVTLMDDLFHELEVRIKALAQKCEHLKLANIKLKQNKLILSREKELLLAKNKLAVTQIENMVFRLKSLEKPL